MSGGELTDLIVSARDTFEEVLGWYGLRPYTQYTDRCAGTSPMDTGSTGSVMTRDTASVTRDTASMMSRDSSAEDADVEVDGDHPVDLTSIAPASSSSAADQGNMSDLLKMQWGSHKKLVGIRFLFPPLDEQMSLLEKARIWVTRHDYKYFVDWTETELDSVDPILRPLSVITRDIYKLHMNRSEYCRNVKLKYCLQSDAPWAQQFRDNLTKSPAEGGFTGLCQAKIVAAELWRKYSEHYRSHQARHPHLRSRDTKMMTTKVAGNDMKNEHGVGVGGSIASGSCYDALCTDSDALSEDGDKDTDGKPSGAEDLRALRRMEANEDADDRMIAAEREDEGSIGDDQEEEMYRTRDASMMNAPKRLKESDAEEPDCKKAREDAISCREFEHKRSAEKFEDGVRNNEASHTSVLSDYPKVINLTKKLLDESDSSRRNSGSSSTRMSREASVKTEVSRESDIKSDQMHSPANSLPYWNVSRLGPLMYQLPMAAYYANPMSCFLDSPLRSPALTHQIYPFGSASQNFAAPSARLENSTSMTPLKKSSKIRSNGRNEINTEYRRSERGLSFLFPSFSDHTMSLMEKVQITITRHKNNYFLGWDEAALEKLDPIVRPKMVVTPEIYKEYCHRNAMKYDSNLQFAMESTEPWAQEFRKKLLLPASEGGFTSLCEVKLEAGRLWREYSGKYRMHNIVKWQMDLNSNTVPAKSAGAGGKTEGRCNRFGFRKNQRRQRLKDQRMGIQRSLPSLQNCSLLTRRNGSLPSPQSNSGLSFAQNPRGSKHLQKGSSCSSPVSGSFSEGASPRVLSHAELPSNDVHRVCRSLDNSPSMGGSCDGSVSSVSAAGDACSSASQMQSPKIALTSKQTETGNEFLFTPLPRQMPVTDQLLIWLERHNNNYFLGFPEESLATLHAYLRPQTVVTREVFQRHIPESMVDVLGKIKWMMTSSEEWAEKFCERLHKSHKDGGFTTFEEALTEAVVLWHINKDKRTIQERSLTVGDSKRHGTSAKGDVIGTRQSQKDDEASSRASVSVNSGESPPATCTSPLLSNLNEIGSCFENESDGHARPKSREMEEEGGDNNNKEPVLLTSSSAASQSGDRISSPCSKSSPPDVGLGSLLQLLWNLRQALHVLCQDNPTESWEHRLAPFLPVLQQVVGANYSAPSTSTGCVVDLVMAVMHRRLEEFFSSKL